MTNRDVVEGVYRAFAAGDLEALLDHCDPAVTVTQTELLPWGGRFVGHAGVGEFATRLVSTTDAEVGIDMLFEAGDTVVEIGRTRGSVRETGVKFDLAEVHVWRLREGKVVSAEFYVDTPAMLAALSTRS